MPFERPGLQQLMDRAAADIATRLPGADALPRRSNLHVLGRVNAGAAHGLHGHLAFLAKQLMPDTAEAEYLNRWAGFWGVRRKPATTATGQATIYGAAGKTVPVGTLLQRSDGARFAVAAEVTLAGSSATLSLAAEAPGQAGNTPASVGLNLVSPLDGIRTPAIVAAEGLTGGADLESDKALLGRLLNRVQKPPHGGAGQDYLRWTLEVAGVTRAYVYGQERMGPGTVSVTFLMDDADYGPIPSADDVQRVYDYLHETDARGYHVRRPVTATVHVFALTPAPLNFSIRIAPDTEAVRAAVQAELKDLIRREAEPEGTLLISHIREAISTAAGENDHTLISPLANVTAATGTIITMGAITWS